MRYGAPMTTIRRARADDADAIATLYLASFRATYDFPLVHDDAAVRSWTSHHVVGGLETWVALEGEETVGFMALSPALLEQLYISSGWTGQGIGTRLVELAKTRRPQGLELWTFQVNEAARRFYRRLGFVEVEYGDGSQNEEGRPDVRLAWRTAT